MESHLILIGGVIFLATLTQSLSGFGSALVAMALLPVIVGLKFATPFVALITLTIEIVLLIRYHHSLHIRSLWPLILASLVGTPMGMYILSQVDEKIALTLLGLVITGYASYALLGFQLPPLEHPIWAYFAGFLGGLLGGAYNTSGPPVILYADCRRWSRDVFKSNLQGYFFVSSVAVVITHYVGGNITFDISKVFLQMLPFMAMGIILGSYLDRILSPALFRRLVLLLLVFMGLRLILFKT